MSHGVHAVQHEVEHKIEHDKHGGGGHGPDDKDLNKKVALLIAVLALFLAFSETLGKSAQTAALNSQIEASNLWNFFQAKNIRRTSTIVAGEQTKLDLVAATDPAHKAAIAKQVDEWTKTAARYRSEPEAAGGKGEGTVELSRRAVEEQHHRDEYLAQVPSLRICVGRVPDRHRAGVGDRHHRHGGAELHCRRARRARARLHGDWAVRAAPAASALSAGRGAARAPHACGGGCATTAAARGPIASRGRCEAVV